MQYRLLLMALHVCAMARGQISKLPQAAVYPSLTTYSTQQLDVFSTRSNAAALAGIKQFSAGLYSERRFMLQELAGHSVVAAVPVANAAFGVSGNYYGNSAYNETSLGIGYGRSLGEAVSVGVGFHYNRLAAAGYGAASVIGFEAGARFRVTEAVQSGLAVSNPVGMKFGKSGDEKLPAIYSMGIGWDASPQLFIGAELQKVEDQEPTINVGLQYAFAERLIGRAGMASATATYYAGFGVRLERFRVDVTASFHPTLGATPGLMLLYSPKQ